MLLRRFLPLLVVSLLGVSLQGAGSPPSSGRADDTVHLPDMQVAGGLSLKDFDLPRESDLKAPDFSASDPFLKVQFPGQAVHAGVATGSATVGVFVDATGQPKDFLLIRCTQDYFGAALLDEARRRTYTAKQFKGAPIPSAFTFTYSFEPPAGMNAISNFEAASRRAQDVQGGAQFIYRPRNETELDGGKLVPTQIALPTLPRALVPADGKPVRALVSFYVDEKGRVRLPNVESSLSPQFTAAAIAALQQWAFKPPVIKGQPVLVHTMRAMTFREEGKK
jgi:TonB family protein